MPNLLPIRLLAGTLLCANALFANPFLPAASKKSFGDIKMLSTFLYAANGNMADGNRVVFDPLYSNSVDMYDAIKMNNPGENFGLVRDGYTLAVEARQPIVDGDTLYYKISNLLPQVYNMHIEVQYLENTSAIAELVDRFTNTRRFISLGVNNSFPVTVTTDPASRAANRFYMVFSAMAGPLPVKFTNTNVSQLADKNVAVQWTAEEEINVDHYEIERSSNANGNFKFIGKTGKQSGNKNYQFTDRQPQGNTSFYRIHAIDIDGKKTYSPVMKLNNTGSMSADVFSVFPNPVQGSQVNVRMKDAEAGEYQLKMLNNSGQVIYATRLKISRADQTFPIILDSRVLAGIYTITTAGENGQILSKKITVQK